MIRRTFRYPTNGEHGVGAVLVGGGLLLFATGFAVFGLVVRFIPVLLAPVFYVALRGYYVRVIRWTTRHPGSDPQPFDDWNQLLVDGLQARSSRFSQRLRRYRRSARLRGHHT